MGICLSRRAACPTESQSGYDFYLDKPTNQITAKQANFEDGNGLKRTCKVGSYPPNALGLYDMHGNVWEWCDDAEKPGDAASLRVFRGGGWFFVARDCRAAYRAAFEPANRRNFLGLRVGPSSRRRQGEQVRPSRRPRAAWSAGPTGGAEAKRSVGGARRAGAEGGSWPNRLKVRASPAIHFLMGTPTASTVPSRGHCPAIRPGWRSPSFSRAFPAWLPESACERERCAVAFPCLGPDVVWAQRCRHRDQGRLPRVVPG